MRRFLSASAATGMALSLICAPLASAQDQHGAAPGGAHSPEHSTPSHVPSSSQHAPEQSQRTSAQHMAPVQHEATSRSTMSHTTMSHTTMSHSTMGHQETAAGGHQWHNGDHYNGDRHVVSNWGYYHANPPPPGYEWVQDGNQLVLISIASGVIASVLANGFVQ